MRNFEFNKWATSFLLSALVIVMISNIVDVLYSPSHEGNPAYQVADTEPTNVGQLPNNQPITFDAAKLMANSDAERGKIVAKKCLACHTFDKGGANRVGPNLWNIVGREKAKISGFAYSRAMSEKGGSWGYDELLIYMHKPQAYVKGTRMAFVGIAKPEEVADLIAYMRSMSDTPLALPN